MIIWNNEVKTCQVSEFCCPADISVSRKVSEKENIYDPLIRSMQLLYLNYKFKFIPINVAGLGSTQPAYYRVLNTLALQGRNPIELPMYWNKSQFLEQLRSEKRF